jgi:glucose/arabinose dehydrogenase
MRNAQAINDGDPMPNTHALLGKMLRLDVDTKAANLEYNIPPDNPFAAGGGRPEIFMIGLRNAWRWTFDRETGDMWIGDVGQQRVEEVTVVRRAEQNGANLGWSQYEGSECFRGPCTVSQIAPQIERTHAEGWVTVIGGQVYRGNAFPDLVGTYFFTDWDTDGRLSTATLAADGQVTAIEHPDRHGFVGATSIHEDGTGELFLTDQNGKVFQFVVVP